MYMIANPRLRGYPSVYENRICPDCQAYISPYSHHECANIDNYYRYVRPSYQRVTNSNSNTFGDRRRARRPSWRQVSPRPSISVKPKPNQTIIDRASMGISLVFCTIGIMWQMFSISSEYFEYGVLSEVIVTKPKTVQPPAMTLCIRYTELINLDIDLPELGISDELSSEDPTLRTIQENVTIGRLLEVTPGIEKFFLHGWVRRRESYYIREGWHSEAADVFNITKFIKDGYICYRFSHRNQTDLNFEYQSKHVMFGKYPGALMGFSLNKSLVSL